MNKKCFCEAGLLTICGDCNKWRAIFDGEEFDLICFAVNFVLTKDPKASKRKDLLKFDKKLWKIAKKWKVE